MAEMFALADAENDTAWRTEEFGELAGAKLKILGKALNGHLEGLDTVAAPNFKAAPLFLPAQTIFNDPSFGVKRAETYPEPVAVDLPGLLASFAAYLDGEVYTKFKITRIKPGASAYGATARAGFSTSDREINAIWETQWIASETGDPLLLSITLKDYEEVKRNTGEVPLFSDWTRGGACPQ